MMATDTTPSRRATPDDVIATYDAVGPEWAKARDRRLIERRWVDRMLAAAPRNGGRRRVLDLGCGSGAPIAQYVADRGAEVTGVDASRVMLGLFQKNLPRARAFHHDMRGLRLSEKFDAILAWDSFFHLSGPDQQSMFPTFAEHAAPGCALMFTSGPSAGTAIGDVAGKPIFHESLSPKTYKGLLEMHGFKPLAFIPEDPDCGMHSVWLARFDGLPREEGPKPANKG
ncbi:methyltransferase family protein [Limimaricola soesokkakensis]|uniref:Methyltransferase family protein n=2 Tax=Limimaricola soesokkakensis TaxID=1343159 RepID=A0A1X6YY99_9RHOB|nr:methyltransferase family protein [Limimaricola soesokkakensis]SLN34430.1 dTDP-3-amino-3,4, 6-trideoxy-alpha-D-glucopyranose [Limimaricola soesokkakensis]